MNCEVLLLYSGTIFIIIMSTGGLSGVGTPASSVFGALVFLLPTEVDS